MKTLFVLIALFSLANGSFAQDEHIPPQTFTCAQIIVPSNIAHRTYAMALSPDGQTLATLATESDSVEFYSMASHALIDSFDPGFDERFALTWSPDSTQIAVSGDFANSDTSEIVIWDVEQKREIAKQTGDVAALDLAWSPTAPLIAFTSPVDKTGIWDLEKNTISHINREGDIVAWNSDGSALAGGWESGAAWVWFSKTDELITSSPADWIDQVAWSPDGRFLATSSQVVATNVYDLGESKSTLFFPDQSVFHYGVALISWLAWSPTNTYLAGASNRGLIFWDVQHNFKAIIFFDPSVMPNFEKVIWTPDGKTLLALSDLGAVYAWNFPCLMALSNP